MPRPLSASLRRTGKQLEIARRKFAKHRWANSNSDKNLQTVERTRIHRLHPISR
jgi:hypothetical protein